MFKNSFISVNENMLISLNNDLSDKYFLKCLINFFNNYDITSYVLNQLNNEEERIKFFNNSLIELKDKDLTQEELIDINYILKIIYFSVKDDFVIDIC